MKKTIVALLPLVMVIVLALSSCDNPKTPPNNVLNRGHEMPNTVIYTFIPGTLSSDSAKGNNNEIKHYLGDGFKPISTEPVQVVEFTSNKDGEIHVVTGKDSFSIKPDIWYKIHIDLINRSGTNINHQFVKDEKLRAMHQFFFRTFAWEDGVSNISKMINYQLYGKERTSSHGNNDDKNIFDFRYGDKFENGTFIDPPIGFDGYIKIKPNFDGYRTILRDGKSVRIPIDKVVLNPVLVHVLSKSKLTVDRTTRKLVPFPFDRPGDEILGVTDIDHRFVVKLNF